MSINPFKIFMIFGVVSAWASNAFEDGKITLREAVTLALELAEILGIPTELSIPGSEPTGEEVIGHTSVVLENTKKETDPTAGDRAPPYEAHSTFYSQHEEGRRRAAKEIIEK